MSVSEWVISLTDCGSEMRGEKDREKSDFGLLVCVDTGDDDDDDVL